MYSETCILPAHAVHSLSNQKCVQPTLMSMSRVFEQIWKQAAVRTSDTLVCNSMRKSHVQYNQLLLTQGVVTWRQEAAGMSHTRTVPSIEELSSQRASWLMTTPVTLSLCPLKRRTILTASTSYLPHTPCLSQRCCCSTFPESFHMPKKKNTTAGSCSTACSVSCRG